MFGPTLQQKNRIGGSALAHVFNQLGGESPDVDDANQLKKAFTAIQQLLDQKKILAGHDRSDGGLITALLGSFFCCAVPPFMTT